MNVEQTNPAPARPRFRRLLGPLARLGLLFAVILLLVLALAGYAGYQAGLNQRETQWRATQAADLQHQYELGVADLGAARYDVAAARFEYVVKIDPAYRDAAEKLAEARQGAAAPATPAPKPTSTEVPQTATPSGPTETAQAAEVFARAERDFADANWDGVIEELTLLHSIDPTYQAVRVDGMFYVAFRSRGIARILGDEIENGMVDLKQAEAFGPLDTEALNYRSWARMYLAALSYWGVNWERTVAVLDELYLVAPYFRDTNTRLFQALQNRASELVAAGDHCAAAQLYAQALTILADPKLSETLAAEQAACGAGPTAEPEASAAPEASATPGG